MLDTAIVQNYSDTDSRILHVACCAKRLNDPIEITLVSVFVLSIVTFVVGNDSFFQQNHRVIL